jgi:hypothetical protein
MTDESRKLPKITRNRLIALGIVVAGVVALAAIRPELLMELVGLAGK